nr:hypothetical protein [Tanacetum cinerariifolium]
MSSASSAITYTFVYIDFEPGMPVAPPSPDYIPGLEEPQTPPVPHDEDEQDEHVFLAEEQPLPPVVSPTAESPGYVAESNPEEDPEEYEDDETEDGPDEDEEEEEEHFAPADSTVVIPTTELISPPEGTEPVIPPPSTDTTTTGARITVWLQASISLPPEAEVESLLAMPILPPSPLTLLSPPFVEECLARCTALPAHSPPPVPSPLLPSFGCPTQIQTLRMASTQALINAVTTALPSPPLPPLPPPIYISPPIYRRDDIPETEMPPRKRSCLFALGSSYEIGESSTTRPIKG